MPAACHLLTGSWPCRASAGWRTSCRANNTWPVTGLEMTMESAALRGYLPSGSPESATSCPPAHVAAPLPANVHEIAPRNGGRELKPLVVMLLNALAGEPFVHAPGLHGAVCGGADGFFGPQHAAMLDVVVGHLGAGRLCEEICKQSRYQPPQNLPSNCAGRNQVVSASTCASRSTS